MDGIVANRLDLPYQPGTSREMQKIKRLRTVDCVVGGVILNREAVSHLLGLYDEAGLLHFIGSAPLRAAEGKKLEAEISKLIQAPGFTGKQPGEVRTQFGHRMGDWHPICRLWLPRSVRSLHRGQVSAWGEGSEVEAG